MDSQGRNVIVCDNGTGVSILIRTIKIWFCTILGWVQDNKENLF